MSTTAAPHYSVGDVLEEDALPDRHHLVLDIGIESYFLQLVSGRDPGEPLEHAWVIPDCEEVTTRVVADSPLTGPGPD
ncbi:hypothetical protein ACWGB8_11260 [Kitasatospora sp. NPDC054939]